MDNDYTIDLDDIVATVASADVVVMRFVALGQRLLFDFRATDLEGPVVRIVRPVRSVEERYQDLRRMRPRFSDPERIVAVWWPRFATSLRESPAWHCALERIAGTGHAASVRAAQAVLEELAALERRAAFDAVRGEGFKTLWSASARRR